MLNQFSSDVAAPRTKGTEITRLAEAYMGTLKMHAFMGNLPTKIKDLGQKRASTSATTTKKMFTEENCRFCVDYHKGKCGPDEDDDPVAFAAHVCPKQKKHVRVGCNRPHQKGENCSRGPSCHFYHGNGHP